MYDCHMYNIIKITQNKSNWRKMFNKRRVFSSPCKVELKKNVLNAATRYPRSQATFWRHWEERNVKVAVKILISVAQRGNPAKLDKHLLIPSVGKFS